MNFCCYGFEDKFGNAGKRGFATFSIRWDDGAVGFVMQHRAMDIGAKTPFTESPLSLISEVLLRFCPWCGQDLDKYYGNNRSVIRSDLKL
jgi:hypothetical protein